MNSSSFRAPLIAAAVVGALLLGFVIARATAPPASSGAGPSGPAAATAIPSHSHGGAVAGDLAGLSLSAGGFTLVPGTTSFAAGAQQQFSFRVMGPDGKPATRFVLNHEKLMHFIVVRHDLTGFQHLHPEMAPDGTWTAPLTLPSPGIFRLYADFVTFDPAGQQLPLTLAVDATVAGNYVPVALPAAARIAEVDGFTVAVEGTPRVNATQPLSFRVLTGGSPVTDLERYLGAYGHLVVVREGDQGYLHVHPEDQLVGGAVKFWLSAPSPGRYRMYFEFQKSGAVHRAEFTFDVTS
ncbi:hypothetical protein GCM10010399_88080 [Dactylosporangium fulvum]|uniref:Secreted protein n=1 Tax=Dactylosporangium fulvum TaxID=53359 RepID=A0ABY5W043_9ACTN|nr:hypothetical protein [Dactylosporangium fulvum]UWP82093.1 hypothetical protein Dfulv_44690 [Dactylosporangium fulvum]